MVAKRKERLFSEYPDVVGVEQMCVMLGGIGKRTAYELLRSGEIRSLKIGKSFIIAGVESSLIHTVSGDKPLWDCQSAAIPPVKYCWYMVFII